MATSNRTTTSKADADKGAAANNASLADVKPDAAENNATLADITGDNARGSSRSDAADEQAGNTAVTDPPPGGPIPVYTTSATDTDTTAMAGTVRDYDTKADRNK